MKTWTAILTHIGIGALQSTVGIPFTSNQIGNAYITLGTQLALVALQSYVATKNSETNSDGTPQKKFDPAIMAEINQKGN